MNTKSILSYEGESRTTKTSFQFQLYVQVQFNCFKRVCTLNSHGSEPHFRHFSKSSLFIFVTENNIFSQRILFFGEQVKKETHDPNIN